MQENFIPQSGFITAVDDPEGLGRVKVHCEAIDGTNPDQETVWVNILKGPEGFGSDSHSPPQVGTRVMVLVNKTNPSLRQVVSIVGSQKQKANPQMPGNSSLAFLREKYEQEKNTLISGPGKMDQEQIPNNRGSTKSKVSVKQDRETVQLSIKERKELPTQISANPQIATQAPPIKNVSTALTPDSSIFTATMASHLPGVAFNLSNIFDHLSDSLLTELKSSISTEVFIAMQNMAATSSTFTPLNADGFLQNIKRVNPATFGTNMLNVLKDVKNVKQLRGAIDKIMNDDSIGDLESMADVALESLSGFGTIPLNLKANGDIEVMSSDLINAVKTLFGQITSGLTSQGGATTFLSGSAIPDTLMERMVPEKAAEFKEMFQKLAGDNNEPRRLIEAKLAAIKAKLE
jgi:hypothetical protein